jgi:hypothetical protein
MKKYQPVKQINLKSHLLGAIFMMAHQLKKPRENEREASHGER